MNPSKLTKCAKISSPIWLMLNLFGMVGCVYGADSRHGSKFTIQVYSLAKVPRQTLELAEKAAGWIFRQAGIEIEWLDCAVSGLEVAYSCPQNVDDPLVSTLKILAEQISNRFDLPTCKFGCALPPNKAFISFDRLRAVTEDAGFSRSTVLAHIMAHELGHLLLDGEEHSASRVMSKTLYSKKYERLSQSFTEAQAERNETDYRGRYRTTPASPT